MDRETILFELHLLTECWDKSPHLLIKINDTEHFNDYVNKGHHIIKFWHTCEFDQPHKLVIVRSGKDNKQVKTLDNGDLLDQFVVLQKIVIDGVNIQNIVWSKSTYAPEYPEPWASQQLAVGNVLPKEVIGATNLGHNGTWQLNFISPFYVFIMQWMGGGVF